MGRSSVRWGAQPVPAATESNSCYNRIVHGGISEDLWEVGNVYYGNRVSTSRADDAASGFHHYFGFGFFWFNYALDSCYLSVALEQQSTA